jgi:hypothetical protein
VKRPHIVSFDAGERYLASGAALRDRAPDLLIPQSRAVGDHGNLGHDTRYGPQRLAEMGMARRFPTAEPTLLDPKRTKQVTYASAQKINRKKPAFLQGCTIKEAIRTMEIAPAAQIDQRLGVGPSDLKCEPFIRPNAGADAAVF